LFEGGFFTRRILDRPPPVRQKVRTSSTMPRTTQSTSQASSSRAQSSHPTIEQRDILFETEFDINGDFKNFEATQWAIREFKRRGLKKLFKPVTSTAYTKLIVEFYSNLSRDCNKPGTLSSRVKGKPLDVTTSDIAAALHCNDEHPPAEAQLEEQPDTLYVSEIIEDMCAGQYADEKRNAGSRSKLPQPLLLVDYVLHRNVCPLGHKSQRRDQFLQALYAFHKGYWYSIPSIIWNQIQKFWDVAITRKATNTKSWGLPFPFLLTHILKKKGIKGTPEDGPVSEHPFFGRNQWNHSQSHMPREVRVELPAEEGGEEAEHMEEDAPPPQQGGRADTVVISRTEYELLSGTHQRLEKDGTKFRQHRETNELLILPYSGTILDRLPPAAGASSSVPPGEPSVSCCTVWLKTLNLALMGGTPQYIHLILLSCFYCYFSILFSFLVLFLVFLCRDTRFVQFKFGGVLCATPIQQVP
jgi:hypothetical protein